MSTKAEFHTFITKPGIQRKIFCLASLLFLTLSSYGLRVSVLTLKPAGELYTLFGHSAIRITDDSIHLDRVYNFGTFNFNTPGFYFRFFRGDLNYSLSADEFETFYSQSVSEHRKVYEQTLNLTNEQKDTLYRLLESCHHSPCRLYRYDFFRVNCATKIRDILMKTDGGIFNPDTARYPCRSYRQLIRPYISDHYWIELGINLILGKEADKKAEAVDYMFLPDYIMSMLHESGKVEHEQVILDASVHKARLLYITRLSPWFLLVLLMFGIKYSRTRKATIGIAAACAGLTGLLLLIISLLSESPAIIHNFNICWTFPALFILPIYRGKIRNLVETLYLIVLILMLLCWNHLPQELSATFIPWMIMLIVVQIADLASSFLKPDW
jgi:hypothetical protein